MPLLSQRAYAKHRGLSESTIRKAIRRGQITKNEQNKIDPVLADKQWDDYAKRKMSYAQTNKPADASTNKTTSTMMHIHIETLIIQAPDSPFDPSWQQTITQQIAEAEKAHVERASKTLRTAFFDALGGR